MSTDHIRQLKSEFEQRQLKRTTLVPNKKILLLEPKQFKTILAGFSLLYTKCYNALQAQKFPQEISVDTYCTDYMVKLMVHTLTEHGYDVYTKKVPVLNNLVHKEQWCIVVRSKKIEKN